jgi:hypothetical protein
VKTVLGLSITTSGIGWVLIDGSGDVLDHDAFDVRGDGGSASQYLTAVRGARTIAAASGHNVHTVGVTWTDAVETEAARLLESLAEAEFDNVVGVPLSHASQPGAREFDRNGEQLTLARGAALTLADHGDRRSDEPAPARSWFSSHTLTSGLVVAGSVGMVVALCAADSQPAAVTEFRAADNRPAPPPASAPVVLPPPAAPPPAPQPPPVAEPPPVPVAVPPPPPEIVEDPTAYSPVVEPVEVAPEPVAPPAAVPPPEPHLPPPAAEPAPPASAAPPPPPPPQDPLGVVLSQIGRASCRERVSCIV